ncbi:uncharacterized protein ASCRUDRAFT_7516 [Ascoidea rubescens DSM 1968]|uniref:Protein kinase domain-containing protein n=1 Tax=Ascoidea rubescens DSM 1968 TaxID=1344418 RepID=A0A1D2VKH7_9ASCO|nr:hypothetical protein ASCRUDRAFT_7516 [Ascoidea rubescens DSM 1968]ODV62088.1 hypothetical protein ASCRUDRAFT_7516 [Ascoidea rubescens DSM 1968]
MFDNIQVGRRFNSQVFSVKWHQFTNAFGSLSYSQTETIILKVFDSFEAKSKHGYNKLKYSDRASLCHNSFKKEIEIYQQINNYNNQCGKHETINILRIYKTGCLMINSNHLYEFCGLCIAMEDLGTSKPSTGEDFKKGFLQLYLLHKLKIYHKDIKTSNMFIFNNKFFFIDYGFSSSTNTVKAYDYAEKDLDALQICKDKVLYQQ